MVMMTAAVGPTDRCVMSPARSERLAGGLDQAGDELSRLRLPSRGPIVAVPGGGGRQDKHHDRSHRQNRPHRQSYVP
jgi:hypothetical protein